MIKEWNLTESNFATTPGTAEDDSVVRGNPMHAKDSARYRSAAAKLNYISLDNPQIAFASKEASRVMSAPTR